METRAERRRRERAERKRGSGVTTKTVPGTPDIDVCSNGHPEQFQAFLLNGIAPQQCPRCGETPVFADIDSMEETPGNDMPESTTTPWLRTSGAEFDDDVAQVPIPPEFLDGLFTHAEYWRDEEDPSIWRLEGFSG